MTNYIILIRNKFNNIEFTKTIEGENEDEVRTALINQNKPASSAWEIVTIESEEEHNERIRIEQERLEERQREIQSERQEQRSPATPISLPMIARKLAGSLHLPNPILQKNIFQNLVAAEDQERRMSLQGTVNKTILLLFVLYLLTIGTWHLFHSVHNFSGANALLLLCLSIVGCIVVARVLKHDIRLSPYLAIIYALFAGLLLGGLSSVTHLIYAGIIFQVVLWTLSILAALLVLHKLAIIEALNFIETFENTQLIVVAIIGGTTVYYLISLLLSFLGVYAPLIHDQSSIAIGLTFIAVFMVALNLVVDFGFIKRSTTGKYPKYIEWYGAIGLLLPLLWLYVELLKQIGIGMMSRRSGRGRRRRLRIGRSRGRR